MTNIHQSDIYWRISDRNIYCPAKNMLYPIFLSLLPIILFSQSHAAGVATHLSHLIRMITDNEINEFSPWLKSGTFFPDSLYSCIPNKEWEQFAEFTHWPKFILISLNYWNEKYGKDQDTINSHDSLALKSFIQGVFTHQIVDASWHSLVTDYENDGLLKYIAEVEFQGDINNAHNFIDTFGDFYSLHSWVKAKEVNGDSWNFFLENNWALPKDTDLMTIVERSGIIRPHGITYSNLKYCVARGYSALVTEIISIKLNRKTILNESMIRYPHIMSLLKEYYMGGEWDNIIMIQNCINHLNKYFQLNSPLYQYLNEETLQLCGNLPPIVNDSNRKTLNISTINNGANIISPWKSFSNFGSSMILGNFMDDGDLYLAVSSPMEDDGKGGVYLIPWSITKSTFNQPHTLEQPFASIFGSKLHKYSLGNSDFLIVSEPGTNTIRFFIAQDIVLILTLPVTPYMKQIKVGAVADINGDGIPDILISAEYSGKSQQGDVYFIDGQNILPYILNGKQNQVIDLRLLRPISLRGKIKLDDYSNFGSSIAVSKSIFPSKRLFIGALNTNTVVVMEYEPNINDFLPRLIINQGDISLFDENKQITKNPSRENGLFGKKIYSWIYQNHHLIAITQHLFNVVYIYEELPFSVVFLGTITLDFSLDEIPYNMNFGEDLTFNEFDNYLYISSPNSFGGIGAIFRIACQELSSSPFKIIKLSKDNLYFTNMMNMSKGFSGFAKTIIAGPDGRIVIGVPQFGYGNELRHQLTGAIMVV